MLDYVIQDGHIKYTNIRRTGLEVALNQIYNVIDFFVIVIILSAVVKAPKENMGGRPGLAPNNKKKF